LRRSLFLWNAAAVKEAAIEETLEFHSFELRTFEEEEEEEFDKGAQTERDRTGPGG